MTLIDTSVWLDHFSGHLLPLADLITANQAWTHPLVIGEIAMGSWKQRTETLTQLRKLPTVRRTNHEEVLWLIDVRKLNGTGIGYRDAHLLASARINNGCDFWTRDKRLKAAAQKLGIASPLV